MERQDRIYYVNMTKKQVEDRVKKNNLIVVPLGATKNHGPQSMKVAITR
jgi:creatinine amidohydrolase